MSSSELSEICLKHGYQNTEFESVSNAMEYAAHQKTLVTGSFYTVSAAREFLKLKGYDEL
jgi:folylpolyglutamate synthase/dihydropteroate synthase